MFCSNCGKELAEGANFCPNCGSAVGGSGERKKYRVLKQKAPGASADATASAQDTPAMAAPETKAAAFSAQKPDLQPAPVYTEAVKPKKKKKGLLATFLVIAVFGILGRIAGYGLAGGFSSGKSSSENTSSNVDAIKEDIKNMEDPYVESTLYGALCQDGSLVYGPLCIPVDVVYAEEDEASEDAFTFLYGADDDRVYYVNTERGLLVSYEASNEESIMSYYEENGQSGEMLDFQKFMVGDYPCIFYGAKAVVDGFELYNLELIAFREKTAGADLIRIMAQAAGEDAYMGVMDSMLSASMTDVPLTHEDTGNLGVKKIAFK